MAPSSDVSSSNLPTGGIETGKERPVPGFERDFITKTGIGGSPTSLTTVDSAEDERPSRCGMTDSEGTLTGEESDLKDIMGRPDDEVVVVGGADDIERLYLGRWDEQGMP